jgi:hypothetical protein
MLENAAQMANPASTTQLDEPQPSRFAKGGFSWAAIAVNIARPVRLGYVAASAILGA